MSTTEITNDTNVIDSREIIERIADLEGADCESDRPDGEGCDDTDCPTCYGEAGEELAKLRELASEGEQSSEDWRYGAALIRDSYFEDYARELADEAEGWPYDYIDWERAADALQMDYTPVEFDGVTYWTR
jgi:hypothetical protein